MFFPRLRRQAKWAFAVMVIVFGAGFVFLGVGSGGLDLGALLQGCAAENSTGTSIEKAQKKVDENPRDAAAQKALANAYQENGRREDAIATYQQYLALKPKDTEALSKLGSLQTDLAETYRQEANVAYLQQFFASSRSTFGADPASKLGRALGQDPVTSAVETKVNTAAQQAAAKYQAAAQAAVATYKKLARIEPSEDNFLALAQTAQRYDDRTTAIKAYQDLLERTDDPTAKEQIRAQIQALRQAGGGASGG